MAKAKFYAYLTDKKKGIADNWPECEKLVSGVPGAKYRGFLTWKEADGWLRAGADYSVKHIAAKPGVYFDSGTGAGRGVEINVTDENGKSLLGKSLAKKHLNNLGHYLVQDKNITNNFGELLACKYALKIAQKAGVKNIFGDSALILDFWSKGFVNKDIPQDTIDLAQEVKKLRYKFEKSGGKIDRIPGASNPADLGYHKE
jgi:ribonuclease H-related protein